MWLKCGLCGGGQFWSLLYLNEVRFLVLFLIISVWPYIFISFLHIKRMCGDQGCILRDDLIFVFYISCICVVWFCQSCRCNYCYFWISKADLKEWKCSSVMNCSSLTYTGLVTHICSLTPLPCPSHQRIGSKLLRLTVPRERGTIKYPQKADFAYDINCVSFLTFVISWDVSENIVIWTQSKLCTR